MCQEKKAEDYSQAIKTVYTQKYQDSKSILKRAKKNWLQQWIAAVAT